MSTFSQVEASVRASADQPDIGRTPQSMILAFANEEYEEVIRRLADFMPDPYRAISADLDITVVTSPFVDISSLTTMFQVLEFQRKVNGRYFGLDPAPVDADRAPKLTWRQRGYPGAGAKIDVFPPQSSVGTYRVLYCAFPGALTASPDATLALPLGGLKYLAACVAARVRNREEEDQSYMVSVRNDAFSALISGLAQKGGVIQTRGRY